MSGAQQTFPAVTARYIQFVIAGLGDNVTDTRLYDGAGTLISGPGSTPDFSLSAAATSQSVAAGQSGPADSLAITSVNSFVGAVSLAASCAQAGITETVTPASTTPPANGTSSSSLTVSVAAGTPPGTYPVTATGTSGALTHTATVNVTIKIKVMT